MIGAVTADRLTELGAEWKQLRADTASLSDQLRAKRARLVALRPTIHRVIAEEARAGRTQVEIVKLTGYTRDAVRKIVHEADTPAEQQS